MKSAALVAFAASQVYAWGSIGHQLTGAIAQKLISPAAYNKVKSLLPSEWKGNMSRAATWADEVKRKAGYAGWSGPLHFVDIQDNPGKSCSPYDEARDCADGKCLVGAIANYTDRLSCDHQPKERQEAAQFLIHFLGDATQPLHACGRLKGGNGAKIGQFDKRHSLNLHTLWDTTMIEKRIKSDYGNSPPRFLDYLVQQAKTTFKDKESEWTSCIAAQAFAKKKPPPTHKTTGGAMAACAADWATDSDGFNCDVVWPPYDSDSTQDFGAEYYDNAIPIIEQQLVKAGVRMARLFEQYLQDC